eukprot:scaffold2504_cov248-Chaetoceros_neogracile.AAC.6
MSATLDSELFCSFFNGAPFFSIPGRPYPVNQYYLEDILETSGYIVEEDSRYAMRSTSLGDWKRRREEKNHGVSGIGVGITGSF